MFLIPLLPKQIGRQATQGAVGPVIVVFIDPVIQYQSCLPNGQELPLVQAVISQSAVKTLVVAILPGLPRLNKLNRPEYSRSITPA